MTHVNHILSSMSETQIASKIKAWNNSYRKGATDIADAVYDLYWNELKKRNPNHPFLTKPEPETDTGLPKKKHPIAMLSTDKAYSATELKKWIFNVAKAGAEVGDSDPIIESMSKLDGIACRVDLSNVNMELYKRGDGLAGESISFLLAKGLQVVGKATNGAVGEIVVSKKYFAEHLSEKFKEERGFVAGMCNSINLSVEAEQALRDGAIKLVLFKDMPRTRVPASVAKEMLDQLEEIAQESPFQIDGVIFQAESQVIRDKMGANNRFNFWQIAKKTLGEVAIAKVVDVHYQVSKKGRLTPVVEVEPTLIENCEIRRLTAHHANYIVANKIGKGAELTITRSGSVIPKILENNKEAKVELPTSCPSCNGAIVMEGDNLFCHSEICSSRQVSRIIHHFSTLNTKEFGQVAVTKLVNHGYDNITKIYDMEHEDYLKCGFGKKQSENLLSEIARTQNEELYDYQIIASFGISSLGRGAAKRILAHHHITEFRSLTPQQLIEIEGFADKTALSICLALIKLDREIEYVLSRDFNIVHTKDELTKSQNSESALAGKNIAITGTLSVPRQSIINEIERADANFAKSVTAKTDYLIIGEKVGAVKITAAQKKGVKVINEAQFKELVA